MAPCNPLTCLGQNKDRNGGGGGGGGGGVWFVSPKSTNRLMGDNGRGFVEVGKEKNPGKHYLLCLICAHLPNYSTVCLNVEHTSEPFILFTSHVCNVSCLRKCS